VAKEVQAMEVEKVIRGNLEREGCKLINEPKKPGQTGVNIIAQKGNLTWYVEVIGFQSHPPTRSREFYEAFFRIISRDRDDPNDILVLGLPKRFKVGMPDRKQQYPKAWGKLGKVFPNLYIWYVDTVSSKIEKYAWSNPFDEV
jgi:hypothetical protein